MNALDSWLEREAESTTPAAIRELLAEHTAGRKQFAVLRTAVAAALAGETLATTIAQISTVLDYLDGALEQHIAKEEGPLFPRLKAALPADDRLIDEMVAEHDLIRIKRDALQGRINDVLDGDHQELRAEFQTLRLAVAKLGARADGPGQSLTALAAAAQSVVEKAEVHFENEEELVFPLVAQLLDPIAQASIEAEMHALDHGGG